MNGYEISTDRERLDLDVIHGFLREAYWSPGVPRDVVERSFAHSLCFGLYAPDGAQAGFARAVTDHATFAWIADVFVLPEHRGRGLGIELVREAVERGPHADLSWHLGTKDAHSLYERFGFGPPDLERQMLRRGKPRP